jgi:hypothetical protein
MKKQERTVNLFTVTTEKRICMSYSSGYSTVRDGPAFLPDFSQNAFFDNLIYIIEKRHACQLFID